MLSVLVPIYNFDVREFVKELHRQCRLNSISFEILCFDDCSNDEFKNLNAELSTIPEVQYKELEVNYGRSKIRNFLAQEAKFETLLFVDCDSIPSSSHYIRNYTSFIGKGTVVYGGRGYADHPPNDVSLYLRWYYGVKRESVTAVNRKEEPYRSFMTNNFLIPKSIVAKIPFDENIIGYGYEDVLFGQQLKKQDIAVVHIDNKLIHIGLESAEVFLQKTMEGMKNLSRLIKQKELGNEIKIYRYAKKMERWRLGYIVVTVYKMFARAIRKNLTSGTPNLKLFDFFKLANLLIVKHA